MRRFTHLSPERLESLLARFSQARIAVIGDFFLDKYLEIDPRLAEMSLETGAMAHEVVRIRHSPGAAGTVVSNLSSLGAGALHAIGFSGDDGESYELRKDLAGLRCDTKHLACDPERRTPTYLKPRDATDPSLAGEHNRYDIKNRVATPGAIEERLIAALDALLPNVDALIVMDQVEECDCGVVTARVAKAIAHCALRFPEVIFWADSRRRIHQFSRVIIKPNQFEAVGWQNPPPDATLELSRLADAVARLRARNQAPVVATCGAAGMLVSDPQLTMVPGVRVDGPIDPTGAGDSATAGTVLALAAGASLPEAALVGNLVASITVQQLAMTGTASREEIPSRLALWAAQRVSDDTITKS